MAEFVTVMKERQRMCDSFSNRQCTGCPFEDCRSIKNIACEAVLFISPEEAEKIIMDWAAEHPQKTLADRFYKLFPDGLKNDRGEPHICPRYLGWIKECDDYSRCSCDDGFVCTKWQTPWEEEE